MATPTIDLAKLNAASPLSLQGGTWRRFQPEGLVSGFEPGWSFSGASPQDASYLAWAKTQEDPMMNPGAQRPTITGGDIELRFGGKGPNGTPLQRTGNFTIDPKTGGLTQKGDWKYRDMSDDTGQMFGEFLAGAAALFGGAAALGAGAGGGVGAGAGLGEVAAGNGAFLGEGVTSGIGAWDAAAGLGGYVPAGAAGAVGGVGTPTSTAGFNLGQMAGAAGTPTAGTGAPAYMGVGSTPAAGAGAGYSAGGLAPVVDAVAIPGLGAGTPNMSLGEAALDLGKSYFGSLGTKDWIQLLSSGYNWMQADDLRNRSGSIDPFGAYRAGYARQLADLMANPSNVTKQPGYTETMKAAEQALTRNLAAQGLTGSGTAAEALAKFGGQFQNQYWQQQIAQLAGLSGANFNNAPAALQADIAGINAQNQIINNLVKILPYLGLG